MGGELPPSGHPDPAPPSHAPFRAGMRGTRRPCFTLSSVPVSIPLPAPARVSARLGALSSRPSFFHRLSPWKSSFIREINFSRQRQGSGRRPLGSETTGISGSGRKGSRPAQSERECGLTGVPLSEGARNPGRLARCEGAASSLAKRLSRGGSEGLSVRCLSRRQSASPALCSPSPARTPGCIERVPGRT